MTVDSIADQCLRQVILYAGSKGLVGSDLAVRCRNYRELDYAGRFRVQTLLAKTPEISSTVGKGGAWRFYPRSLAPRGAFNVGDFPAAGEAIMRAIART